MFPPFVFANCLEDATVQKKYDYWLSIEDIENIIRSHQMYKGNLAQRRRYKTFSIINSPEQLDARLRVFLIDVVQLQETRLTLILNSLAPDLGKIHWASLVIHYKYQKSTCYYLSSDGRDLPPAYKDVIIRDFALKPVISLHAMGQASDRHNSGLRALEDARALTTMVDENKSLRWLSTQLNRSHDAAYFIEQRKLFSRQLRENSASLVHPSLAVPSEVTAKTRARRADDAISENPPKKQKILVGNVDVRLKLFVQGFVRYFLSQLPVYYKKASASEYMSTDTLYREMLTGSSGAVLGMAIALQPGGAVPSVIASFRSLAQKFKPSMENAQKIMRLFSPKGKAELCEHYLIPVATKLFQSYEQPLSLITDKIGFEIAMDKCAVDAVQRAFNGLQDSLTEDSVLSSELILKAILEGNSIRRIDPSIRNKKFTFSGYKVQNAAGDPLNTGELFQQVGLRVQAEGESRPIFYRRKDIPASATKYGYRLPFSWESDSQGGLKAEYQNEYIQADQVVLQLYNYILTTDYLEKIATKSRVTIPPLSSSNSVTDQNSCSDSAADQNSAITPKNFLFELKAPIKNFFGRVTKLIELDQLLSQGSEMAVITQKMDTLSFDQTARTSDSLQPATQTTISGMGGVGKTQLALEYAKRYAYKYDFNVFWIDSAPLNFANNIKKIAKKLNIEFEAWIGKEKPIEWLLEDIYEKYSAGKCLIIFDNVENYQSIKEFLPKPSPPSKKNPTILITSRYNNWENVAQCLALDVFTEQESLGFLKRELSIEGDSEDPQLKILHGLLDGLPLALQQAASTIKMKRREDLEFNLLDYINIFRAENGIVLKHAISNNDPYLKTVWTTWGILEGELKNFIKKEINKDGEVKGDRVIELLYVMSFFNPYSIQHRLFKSFLAPYEIGRIFKILNEYSILTVGLNSEESSMHRLFQTVLRFDLNTNRSLMKRNLIFSEVVGIENEIKNHGYFNDERYVAHVFNINLHKAVYKYSDGDDLSANYLGLWQVIMESQYDPMLLTSLLDSAYFILPEQLYTKFLSELIILSLTTDYDASLKLLEKNINEKLNNGLLSQENMDGIFSHPKLKLEDYQYEVNTKFFNLRDERRKAKEVSDAFKSLKNNLGCRKRTRRDLSNVYCSVPDAEAVPLIETAKILYWKHIHRVRRLANLGTQSLMAKNIATDLLQGNVEPWINFAIVSSSGHYLGKYLLSSADNLVLQQSANRLLTNTLKVAAQFFTRSTSTLYFAYNFARGLRSDPSNSIDNIENFSIITLDLVATGLEAAEVIGYLTTAVPFSAITGPISEVLIFFLMLDIERNSINKRLSELEQLMHLNTKEYVREWINAFFGRDLSIGIRNKLENTEKLNWVIQFLAEHPNIQSCIFPAKSFADSATKRVDLRDKKTLYIDRAMPEKPQAGNLFCLNGYEPGGGWSLAGRNFKDMRSHTQRIFFCQNTIGFQYEGERTGNLTLIALHATEVEENVYGPAGDTLIILSGRGEKKYNLGKANNQLMLEGKALIWGKVEAGLDNNNINSINLLNYQPLPTEYDRVLLDKKSILCAVHGDDPALGKCFNDFGLQLIGFTQLKGRVNKPDTVHVSAAMNYVDLKGGGSDADRDHILINEILPALLNIILRPNTAIKFLKKNTQSNTIVYTLHKDQIGKAELILSFDCHAKHQFYFPSLFESVESVHWEQNFNKLSFKLRQSQGDFELSLINANDSLLPSEKLFFKNSVFIFNDGVRMQIPTNQSLYFQLHKDESIEHIIQRYVPLTQRLKKAMLIRTMQGEVIAIGGVKQEILNADGVLVTHLVGNKRDSIYIIRAPADRNPRFPLKDITLHKLDYQFEPSTDTLDLSDLLAAARVPCNIVLSQENHDLILKVMESAHQHPIIKIIFKKLLVNKNYQDIHVMSLQSHPQRIIFDEQHAEWKLVPIPLIFDRHKNIIFITNDDITEQDTIMLAKNRGRYKFSCYETDLILSNADNEELAEDIYTIIFHHFYQAPAFKSKVISLTAAFLDRYVVFADHVQAIQNTPCLETPLDLTIPVLEASTQRRRREISAFRPKQKISFNPLAACINKQRQAIPLLSNQANADVHPSLKVSEQPSWNETFLLVRCLFSKWLGKKTGYAVNDRINKAGQSLRFHAENDDTHRDLDYVERHIKRGEQLCNNRSGT